MFDQVAAKLLQTGAIGVLPTDTIYGVVAKATDEAAVARLYKLKHRHNKPGTVIAASIQQLEQLGLKRRYLKAVHDYWPGPISVIIPCGPELDYLHQGKLSVAVRLPAWPQLQTLLETTGPLLTSSANHPAEPPATTVTAARAYFDGDVDFYVDGGDLSGRQPSTVVRIIDDAVEVLRRGAVQINEQPSLLQ